jgi:hypothetical protein
MELDFSNIIIIIMHKVFIFSLPRFRIILFHSKDTIYLLRVISICTFSTVSIYLTWTCVSRLLYEFLRGQRVILDWTCSFTKRDADGSERCMCFRPPPSHRFFFFINISKLHMPFCFMRKRKVNLDCPRP